MTTIDRSREALGKELLEMRTAYHDILNRHEVALKELATLRAENARLKTIADVLIKAMQDRDGH